MLYQSRFLRDLQSPQPKNTQVWGGTICKSLMLYTKRQGLQRATSAYLPASIRLLEAINIFQKESKKLNIHRELEGLFVQSYSLSTLCLECLLCCLELCRLCLLVILKCLCTLPLITYKHLKNHPCTTSPHVSNKTSVANII